jgi:hypothetical protein
MIRSLILFLLLTSCASFDRTNILPGQRVIGLGFSFTVPTQKSWFAVEYGSSHRIKLSQLNQHDSYSILVSLNRGPRAGMYQSAEAHLQAFQQHKNFKLQSAGLIRLQHEGRVDARYGELCVWSSTQDEDWRGRNNVGPALVDSIALSCLHPEIPNVLISINISRRYELDGAAENIAAYADELFSSLEYQSLE